MDQVQSHQKTLVSWILIKIFSYKKCPIFRILNYVWYNILVIKNEKNKFENILRNMEENDSVHIDKIKAKLKLNMEGREYYD